MSAVQVVTREQVDAALLRVEQGQGNKDDANLIRSYLQRLEYLYKVYALDLDDEDDATFARKHMGVGHAD